MKSSLSYLVNFIFLTVEDLRTWSGRYAALGVPRGTAAIADVVEMQALGELFSDGSVKTDVEQAVSDWTRHVDPLDIQNTQQCRCHLQVCTVIMAYLFH